MKIRLKKIFELASKYGAGVIALTMNEKGIPMSAEERLVLAKSLLCMAKQQGVKERDLIIDTLTLSLSSNQKEAMVDNKGFGNGYRGAWAFDHAWCK